MGQQRGHLFLERRSINKRKEIDCRNLKNSIFAMNRQDFITFNSKINLSFVTSSTVGLLVGSAML